MSNFLLGYGNQTDTGTLAAGSWSASFPLNNLLDYRLGKKARSTNALTTSTLIRLTLPASVAVGIVALISTNLSPTAQYRVRLFSDAGFSSTVYDSSPTDVYPVGSVPSARPSVAEIARFQNNMVHVLTSVQTGRYWEIQITDTGNAAGYVEAGRLFVGSTWQPAVNCDYGDITHAFTSRTNMVYSNDGTPYYTSRRPNYAMPVAFKQLTQAEAMSALDVIAMSDVYNEVMAVADPGDPTYAFRRRIFGRLKQLDPIGFPMFAKYSAAFQVEGPV